jgi:WD40 repeat protein
LNQQVTCGHCGCAFVGHDAVEIPDVLPAIATVDPADQLQPVGSVPWYLYAPAVLALGIPLIALFLAFLHEGPLGGLMPGGFLGAAFAGVAGLGLAGAGVILVRRRNWPGIWRMLGALGITGFGYLALAGAIGVGFVQSFRQIDAAAWQEFAPPEGRFRLLMPGKPVSQPKPPQAAQAQNFHLYALELKRQDVVFAVGYADLSLEEWRRMPIQERFDGSRDGILANTPGSRVVAENRIALRNYPGREYHLIIAGQGMTVLRVYFVRLRIYTLLAGGSWLGPDSADVRKFFDSFEPDHLDEKEFPPLGPADQPPGYDEEDVFPGRTILDRNPGRVIQLAASQDGLMLAAACEDRSVLVWNLATHHGTFWAEEGDGGFVQGWPCIALSPDGQTLAMGRSDGFLKLAEVSTGRHRVTLEPKTPPGGEALLCLAFSPSGRFLVSGHFNNEARLWDTSTGQLVRRLGGHSSAVASVTFTPDGRSLVTKSSDGTIRIWDPASGAELKSFSSGPALWFGQGGAATLFFAPDGRTLLSFNSDGQLQELDANTGQALLLFRATAGFTGQDRSRDGRLLASGGMNGAAAILDAATGKTLWSQPGDRQGLFPPVRGLAFVGGDKQLALVQHGRLELWQLDRLIKTMPAEGAGPGSRPPAAKELILVKALPALLAHVTQNRDRTVAVSGLALSPHGSLLVTISYDKTAKIWDTASWKQMGETIQLEDTPTSVAVSPDGQVLVIGVGSQAQFFHLPDGHRQGAVGEPMRETTIGPTLRVRRWSGELITALAFAPDGKTLATGSGNPAIGSQPGKVRLWDLPALKERLAFTTPPGGLGSLAFSPDGGTLATAGILEPLVHLWNVATGKESGRLKGHTRGVQTILYSHDGRLLVSAGADHVVKFWDAASHQETRSLDADSSSILALALSADDKLVAWGCQDATVKVAKVASGGKLVSFRYANAVSAPSVTSLVFTHDRRTLIAGLGDGSVQFGDVSGVGED